MLTHTEKLQTQFHTPAILAGSFSRVERIAAHEKEVSNLLEFVRGQLPLVTEWFGERHAKHPFVSLQA
jgi:hypothetical protein